MLFCIEHLVESVEVGPNNIVKAKPTFYDQEEDEMVNDGTNKDVDEVEIIPIKAIASTYASCMYKCRGSIGVAADGGGGVSEESIPNGC